MGLSRDRMVFTHMPIDVSSYNPKWANWFIELRKPIIGLLSDLVVDVVHVGSTSVPGMHAKPVIDIDVVIDDWQKFQIISERLETLGYKHIGDLGIKEREAFKLDRETKYRHNLYVCHNDSVAYRNHILLKKHLSENPRDLERYNALKKELSKSVENIDEYTRSKTELILEFLAAEGLSDEEIDSIRSENLS